MSLKEITEEPNRRGVPIEQGSWWEAFAVKYLWQNGLYREVARDG